MGAGQRRQLVTLEVAGLTRDSTGQATENYHDLCTEWVEIEPLTGAELLNARQIIATASYRVTCRYITKRREHMRFTWTREGVTRHLNILHIANDERRREQVCLCEEKAAA